MRYTLFKFNFGCMKLGGDAYFLRFYDRMPIQIYLFSLTALCEQYL